MYTSDLSKQKKYYVLAEFAYPSGDLHLGHWFTFGGADIYARFKRMQGYTVFFPNGFDAFGLPAENAAIQRGTHPQDWTMQNIAQMKKQYATMGASFSFDHEVVTCDPSFYRWNQWIFLKLYERGLAYRGKQLSNWCNICQTVLANEGVENGTCWRCHNPVVLKEVEQWFFKITDYADRLLWSEKPSVDWPKSVRDGQNGWIGRSEGVEIKFKVESGELRVNEEIVAYTVFPETIFGVTYMVLAPEHPLVAELLNSKLREVREYVEQARRKSELERTALEKEKTGVFTGLYCINPANGGRVPVWVADYVIGTYGTGAVMGVPGSDKRDYHFAKTFRLPIIRVIGETRGDTSKITSEKDVLEEGWIVNSGQFDGLMAPNPAREKFVAWIKKQGFGKRKMQYHLHDWSISRQRYWGSPIPIIHCEKCGMVPVPYEDLPVELPYEVDYTPKGKPPLASNQKWLRIDCPVCGGEARRDAETMDTFVDSSWYFFRYLSPTFTKGPFDQTIAKGIMPVDIYFGGAEHTLGHTLYSRFVTKFFKDLELTDLDEYARRRVNHGVILGPDGYRMSKSRGNVVVPDEEVKKFGADTIRVYLAFFMPYEATGPWVSDRVYGAYRFLRRVWDLFNKAKSERRKAKSSTEDMQMIHKTIKKVTEDIEAIKFNTAVAALMEWLNYLLRKDEVLEEEYRTFLLLLAPFAPHITEELWQWFLAWGPVSRFPPASARSNLASSNELRAVGNPSTSATPRFSSIHLEKWPAYDPKFFEEEEVTIVVQVDGKVRDTLRLRSGQAIQKEVEEKARVSERVRKYLEVKHVRRVVYVEGKIINFVTK